MRTLKPVKMDLKKISESSNEAFLVLIDVCYFLFSRYTRNPDLEGCPCCVSEEDKHRLLSKPLKLLSTDDLYKFTFKAMSTWGEVNDFKHYLPRILELIFTESSAIDIDLLHSKLLQASFFEWPETEQQAVLNLAEAAWPLLCSKTQSVSLSDLQNLDNLGVPLLKLLHVMECEPGSATFPLLVRFIDDCLNDLLNQNLKSSRKENALRDQIKQWSSKQHALLERGFYFYEASDSGFAKQISDTLYRMEHFM